ncbi:MAG: ribose 5-phosphate isomerase B [Bacteroidales bacterium]
MQKKVLPIALGGDHAGFYLKEKVKIWLKEMGYQVKDYGPFSEERVDYPDQIHPLARAIENGTHQLGIIMCGSGNGVSMTANKYQGIRAALCWEPELARLARAHNDANVLSLPARFIDETTASAIVDIFMKTSFEGGRHINRVKKIACS